MEILFVIGIPILILLATTLFLIISHTSGFLQYKYYLGRQQRSNMIIQQFIQRLAFAQSQIYQRTKELEILTSKLELSNQELKRLNEMKSKFLSMVVHDIRTPLSSIKGFSELLHRKMTDQKAMEYSKNIIMASDQLARLISDLTDLAMIEAGKLRMEKKVFHFPEIVLDILPSIKISAAKKGVILIVSPMPEGIYVEGDKFRLSQVLMNLLNNAIKFTPQGKNVEVFFKKEGKFITTLVKDSGIGIHPGETKKIFEKFYQSNYLKDEKLKKQGWGLGLAIASEIIRQHKGEIAATSRGLGKGATFYFKIPVYTKAINE